MQLTTVHKITIGTATLGSALYALWSAYYLSVDGSPEFAFGAGVALLTTTGLIQYLRRFNATKINPGNPASSAQSDAE